MDFDLSADQEALRDAARDLLDGVCGPEVARAALEVDGYDGAVWQAMVDQGWLGVATAEAGGGLGLGTVEAVVLLEQAGAHLAPVPLVQQLLAQAALQDPAAVAGERLVTVAHRAVAIDDDRTLAGRPEPVIFRRGGRCAGPSRHVA